ncbi:MAG: carbon monoxide dehydrogenase subunit G [Rhizomicrobium sp.]|jgi:carbon monoxide dehydrogenase subunit G
MEFTGRYLVPAPLDITWAALNDPEILRACIPGCQQMTKTDPTHFEAAATLKIGPVKATFKAKIEMADIDPPWHCTLKGEGQGGVAGFARGEAEVTLAPEGGGTALSYTAKAAIGGKLAQIGQRLIDGAAKQIADDFFTRFSAAVGAIPAGTDADVLESHSVPAAVAPDVKREGLAPEIWVVGLIGVIVILLLLFGLVL